MIHIGQGHEKGIGLEVLIKAFSLIPSFQRQFFQLHVSRLDLEQNLKDLNIEYQIDSHSLSVFGMRLNCQFVKPKNESSTQSSLTSALDSITQSDVLITLPTSKDQLELNGKTKKGYTEFLRSYYNRPNLCMTFVGPNEKTLLISDHIPLIEVTSYINSQIIFDKIRTTLNFYKNINNPFDEIHISGINPHAGENGLLGDEEITLKDSIEKLKSYFPDTQFNAFIPGDTLDYLKNNKKNQLFVYMFHDQGLSKFKALNHTIGINQTLGLPFLRLSVDHGTAFNLYGKNIADYMGCFFLLEYALEYHLLLNS